MNKKQLEESVKKRIEVLNRIDTMNNSYHAEIKLRKTALRHKLAHREAQRKYRKAHPNYDKDYYLKTKKNCEHIAKIVFNEAQSTSLVCSKCGCLIAKVNF